MKDFSLKNIIENDDRESFEILLSADRNIFEKYHKNCTNNETMQTLLHFTVKKKAFRCFKFLVQIYSGCPDVIDKPDMNGTTALHIAVINSCTCKCNISLNIMKVLIEVGANLNCRNLNGDSPLHAIVESVDKIKETDMELYLKCLELAIEGADINAMSLCIQTPLDKLLDQPHVNQLFLNQICEIFFSKGAFVNELNSYTLNQLGIGHSIRSDIVDERPEFTLINNILLGDISASNFDVSVIPKIWFSRYVGTKSILFHVSKFISEENLKEILSWGTDPWIENIDDGKIPLHSAFSTGRIEICKMFLQHMKKRSVMIDLRSKTLSLMTTILTDMHIKDDHLKCDMLKLLLRKDVLLDLNQQDKYGHYSVRLLLSLTHNTSIKTVIEQRCLEPFCDDGK